MRGNRFRDEMDFSLVPTCTLPYAKNDLKGFRHPLAQTPNRRNLPINLHKGDFTG